MIGAIVQARMSSVRLPGKVMKSLPFESDRLLIDQIINALMTIKLIGKIIVATTLDSADDVICHHIESKYGKQINVFRGSEKDVLARYYFAAKENNLQTIFRFTADNPFIDAELVTETYTKYKQKKINYLTTVGYPLGFNLEVFDFFAIERTHKQATLPYDREHVTSYIRAHPECFNVGTVVTNQHEDLSEIRLTVDTDLDYILACCIFDYYKNSNMCIMISEIRALHNLKPWLFKINRNALQKRQYLDKKEEIIHAISLIENLEMPNVLSILKNTLNCHTELTKVV